MTGTEKAADIMEYEGKPKALIYAETMISILDLLGVCKWMGLVNFNIFTPENLAELLSAGLGKNVTPGELIDAAERIRNVERAFEIREGLTRKDDTVPEREFNKDIGGRLKGVFLDRDKFEKAKDEYYTLRGWDVKKGAPTTQTLMALGLDDVSEDLKKRKLIS
jgi:aldehyde:ferredoxin oxidoreductase